MNLPFFHMTSFIIGGQGRKYGLPLTECKWEMDKEWNSNEDDAVTCQVFGFKGKGSKTGAILELQESNVEVDI